MIRRTMWLAAAIFCVCPLSANGNVIIGFTGATNPLDNVNMFSPGTTAAFTQSGTIGNTALLVDVMSDLEIESQGATTLRGDNGAGPLMSSSGNLMITFDNFLGVKDFSQNLTLSSSSTIPTDTDVKITVNFTDASGNNPMTTSMELDFGTGGGDKRYDVYSTMGEIITKVTLEYINGAVIDQSKQIRINPNTAVIPEPAALILFGSVAALGASIRRRRR